MLGGSPFSSWARVLILTGIFLVIVGVLMLVLDRLGIVGRLPGDIVVRRKNWTLWFPLVTCVIISIVLTIILNLFRR